MLKFNTRFGAFWYILGTSNTDTSIPPSGTKMAAVLAQPGLLYGPVELEGK